MSAVLPAAAVTHTPWRQALAALGLVLLAVVLLYRDTGLAMVTIWNRSDTFAHAFLVAPISLWLAWRLRHRLAALSPQPQPWLLLAMAAASCVWLLGDMAGVNALTQAMFVALLVVAVPAVLGLAVARELAFPLVYLFFMVPFGEFLLPSLMEGTADFTVWALAASGVPVYREGLNFIIPSGSWSVVEACSGVRYLIASFMVGSLFAYLNYTSTKRRLIFCLVSLALPIVANWLRAYLIVMLGHFSNNKVAVGVDHLIYGWAFFGIVITMLFFIGSRWAEPPASLLPASSRVAISGEPASVASYWTVAIAATALVAWPQAAMWQMQQSTSQAKPVLALPLLSGTSAPSVELPSFEPVFQNPSAVAQRTYGVGPRAVSVHVAYFRGQRYGQKLVTSENMLVKPGSVQWTPTRNGQIALDAGGRAVTLRTAEIVGAGALGQGGRERLEVRQVYWVDGRFTASEYWAVAWGVWGRIAGRGDDGAMLTFYTAGDTAEGAAELVDGFARAHLGELGTQLAAVRAGR